MKNRTFEFRLRFGLLLDAYRLEDVAIFFAEGAGQALWRDWEQLRRMADLGLLVPFLNSLLTKQKWL